MKYIIETERLYLRELCIDNRDESAKILSDPGLLNPRC
jgi:hypothetical protein